MRRLNRIAYKQYEAAKAIGVSDRTLRNWMKEDNPPPHIRIGGNLLFIHEDLLDWLRKKQEAKEEVPNQID